MEKPKPAMQKILIWIVKGYRYVLSPYLGSHCRYHPSCSSYAITALERHGFVKGVSLSVKRVLRCHPWHEGGFDPVPDKNKR